MHRFGILVGLVLLTACSAFAQDTSAFQVAAGYQYDRFYAEPGKAVNCSGGSAQMDWFFAHNFALVADLGICNTNNISPYVHDIPPGVSSGANLMTYQVGPKFAWRSSNRVEPFAQGLFGGASASIYCSNCVSEIGGIDGVKNATISATFNTIAMTAGGGLDVRLSDLIAIRVAQAQYLLTYGNGAIQNSFQLNSGIVFRLGERH